MRRVNKIYIDTQFERKIEMKQIFIISVLLIVSPIITSAMPIFLTAGERKTASDGNQKIHSPLDTNENMDLLIMNGGVNDGGSGNSPIPVKMDNETFNNFTKYKLKKILRLIFQTIEYNSYKESSSTTSLLGNIYADGDLKNTINSIRSKLFKKNENIFDILDKAKMIVQKQPCHTPFDYILSDGSADKTNLSVCLSYDRLAPKLSMEDFSHYIIALAAHEYSHLLGTTEQEANLIQQEVLNNIRIGGRSGSLLLELAVRSLFGTENILRQLNIILEDLEAIKESKLDKDSLPCDNIIMIDKFYFGIESKRSDFYWSFNLIVEGAEFGQKKTFFKNNLDNFTDICNFRHHNVTIEKQKAIRLINEMKSTIEYIHKAKNLLSPLN